MPQEHLHLWDEDVEVLSTEEIQTGDKHFLLHHVHASDDTNALVALCEAELTEDVEDMKKAVTELLHERGLQPQYSGQNEYAFITAVTPVHETLAERFGKENIGVVVLVDGREPGNGSYALEEMRGERGSVVQVLYRIAHRTQSKVRHLM